MNTIFCREQNHIWSSVDPSYTSIEILDRCSSDITPCVLFSEQRSKQEVKFYPNETISYRELRNYTFDRSRSGADETLRINTINVVYMVVRKKTGVQGREKSCSIDSRHWWITFNRRVFLVRFDRSLNESYPSLNHRRCNARFENICGVMKIHSWKPSKDSYPN